MKKILLLLFFFAILYPQSSSCFQPDENQFDYFNSYAHDLKDARGNRIFNSTNNDSLVFSGQAINNNFGCSVSSAGDVNGDGYSDIIVGANNYSNGWGRAYIYLGGITMDTVADIVITGQGYLGMKVSSAGDFNGDGYSDVLVGSFLGIYVYFGGINMNNQVDVILSGYGVKPETASNAGDVNGDGYSDIIAGANTGSSTGCKAYIYLGKPTFGYGIDIIIEGGDANRLGFQVSTAGDVNGDGYSDVLVSDYAGTGTNSVYIFFGGFHMDVIADVTTTATAYNNGFGWSIANAGDVNSDGFSDIIIGTLTTSNVYIYFGGISMNNTVDITLTGMGGHNSVSSAGDVNWDGYSDVVVGNSFSSQAFVFYGGLNMDNFLDITLTSEFLDDRFGYSVSSSGDVNADGYDDIIIGSPLYDNQKGRAYLYYNLEPKPELINPTKNSINNPVDLIFKWKKINGASYYKLNISTDSLFNNIVVNDSLQSDTSKNVTGLSRDTKYFWRVIAKDTLNVIHNSSEWSFTTVPPLIINVKLLLEGLYSPSFNQMIRKDTVATFLRYSTPPYNIIDSAKSVIDSIWFSGLFKFYFTPTGTYYLTIKHLNSIETWSKLGGEFIINDGSIYNYDFTTDDSQAFGNNLKFKGSKYCLYSGDVNQDGFITLFDVIPIYNDSKNFVTGRYLVNDLNGDGFVDLADMTICSNNSKSFIRVLRP